MMGRAKTDFKKDVRFHRELKDSASQKNSKNMICMNDDSKIFALEGGC